MDYPWTQADQTPELDSLANEYGILERQIKDLICAIAKTDDPLRRKVLMRDMNAAQKQLAMINIQIKEIERWHTRSKP